MSANFIARIVGMIFFSIIGGIYGYRLGMLNEDQIVIYTSSVALIGALVGLILTPYFTTVPMNFIRNKLTRLSAESLLASLAGLIAGLLIAALLAFPLSLLPKPFGEVLPFVGVVIFVYFGITLFSMRQTDISNLMGGIGSKREGGSAGGWQQVNRTILLDTSVIIDGRVADIAKTGFLPGTLLIPRFVLNELQYIADFLR